MRIYRATVYRVLETIESLSTFCPFVRSLPGPVSPKHRACGPGMKQIFPTLASAPIAVLIS